jgi:hypothetical protein
MKYKKENRFTGEYYHWNEIGGRSTIESSTYKEGFKMNRMESDIFEYMELNHKHHTIVGVFKYTLIPDS